MSSEPGKSNWKDRLNLINLIITMLIAVMGFYLKTGQDKLKEEFEKEKVMQVFVKQVNDNIDNLKLGDDGKRDIGIALLEIITEANLNEGEVAQELREEIPVRLALASGSSEMLARLGNSGKKRQSWVKLAAKSNDLGIKRTALETVENLLLTADTEEDINFYLKAVLDISEDLTISEINEDALDLIQLLWEKIKFNDLDFDISKHQMQINSAIAAFITSPENENGSDPNFMYLPFANAQYLEFTSDKGFKEQREERINKLLKELETTDLRTRRNARNLLTLELIPEENCERIIDKIDPIKKQLEYNRSLLYALDKASSIARGLDSTMFGVKLNITIRNISKANELVSLLDHTDFALRKYTSEVLGKIHDGPSQQLIFEAMKPLFNDLKKSNGIFNSIMVLSHWQRNKKELNQNIKASLENLKKRLEEDSQPWKRTKEKLKSIL